MPHPLLQRSATPSAAALGAHKTMPPATHHARYRTADFKHLREALKQFASEEAKDVGGGAIVSCALSVCGPVSAGMAICLHESMGADGWLLDAFRAPAPQPRATQHRRKSCDGPRARRLLLQPLALERCVEEDEEIWLTGTVIRHWAQQEGMVCPYVVQVDEDRGEIWVHEDSETAIRALEKCEIVKIIENLKIIETKENIGYIKNILHNSNNY